jgi:hypothetical protein
LAGYSFVLGAPLDLVVQQAPSDGRVAARGGVGQVEDQGEVQRVGADGQDFVQ